MGIDLSPAFVGFEPRRAAPIPLPGLERFDVAVGKGHVASAIVPQERASPVWVAGIDNARTRFVAGGIVHNPAFGFFWRVHGDAFFGVFGIERKAPAIG